VLPSAKVMAFRIRSRNAMVGFRIFVRGREYATGFGDGQSAFRQGDPTSSDLDQNSCEQGRESGSEGFGKHVKMSRSK
jgi:hypothetical protein